MSKYNHPEIRAMQDEVMRMAGWPHTPGQSRLDKALNLLAVFQKPPGMKDLIRRHLRNYREHVQEYLDAAILDQEREIQEFRTWAYEELQEVFVPPQNELAIIYRVMTRANRQNYTGLAAIMPRPEGGDRPWNAGVKITMVRQSQEWTGLDPAWANCSRLEVHLMGAGEPLHRVFAAIAAPPEWRTHIQMPQHPIQYGPERDIQEIAMWHGAERCILYRANSQ